MRTTDSRKTIGYVIKTFPKVSESFILHEILGLERLGIVPVVFSLQHPSDHELASALPRVSGPIEYFGPPTSSSSGRDSTSLDKVAWLKNAVSRHGIHHLHAHFADEPASLAATVSRSTDIPFSFTAHAKDIYVPPPEALRRTINAALFVVTCTGYNWRYLDGLSSGNAPIYHLYHGIDLRRFPPPIPEQNPQGETAPIILSVGRFREKKGFPTLLQACRLLKHQGQDFRCHLIGYGPLQDRLVSLVRELGLRSQVEFLGKMGPDAVLAHYRRATVFALPCQIAENGDRDGIPNVLLEAMAMGLPVVTTGISGIPELVRHEHNGLLVPPQEPEPLASALARLLADRDLRHTLGTRGQDTVRQGFSLDRTVRMLKALFSAERPTPEATHKEDGQPLPSLSLREAIPGCHEDRESFCERPSIGPSGTGLTPLTSSWSHHIDPRAAS